MHTKFFSTWAGFQAIRSKIAIEAGVPLAGPHPFETGVLLSAGPLEPFVAPIP